jgi:hypothetical protein
MGNAVPLHNLSSSTSESVPDPSTAAGWAKLAVKQRRVKDPGLSRVFCVATDTSLARRTRDRGAIAICESLSLAMHPV